MSGRSGRRSTSQQVELSSESESNGVSTYRVFLLSFLVPFRGQNSNFLAHHARPLYVLDMVLKTALTQTLQVALKYHGKTGMLTKCHFSKFYRLAIMVSKVTLRGPWLFACVSIVRTLRIKLQINVDHLKKAKGRGYDRQLPCTIFVLNTEIAILFC